MNKKYLKLKLILIAFITLSGLFVLGYNTFASFVCDTGRVFNVRDYGAKGDSVTDDTASIQTAVNAAAAYGKGNIVLIPDGTYMINGLQGIVMKNYVNLRLSTSAVLRVMPNASKWYYAIKAWNVNNISISGGAIEGERQYHITSQCDGLSGQELRTCLGEWGMGIDIRDSNLIEISDITVKNNWGDGIYLGQLQTGINNKDISIKRVVADNNRRQGISIVTGENIFVEDSILKNTNGTPPAAGIDLEPNNYATQILKNITLRNISTQTNSGPGAQVILGSIDFYITIENHTDISSSKAYNFQTITNPPPAAGWKGIIIYNGQEIKYQCTDNCPVVSVCQINGVCGTGESNISCPLDCLQCDLPDTTPPAAPSGVIIN